MPTKNFIWIDGNILDGNNPALFASNRSFLYGDGVFETILAYSTEAKHLSLHLARLIKGMKVLEIDIPPYLNETIISETVTRLLNKNRFFGNARVRITVFRNSDGFYTPTSNAAGVLIQTQELNSTFYELNKQDRKSVV